MKKFNRFKIDNALLDHKLWTEHSINPMDMSIDFKTEICVSIKTPVFYND